MALFPKKQFSGPSQEKMHSFDNHIDSFQSELVKSTKLEKQFQHLEKFILELMVVLVGVNHRVDACSS